MDKEKEGAEGTDLEKREGIILNIILLGSVCVYRQLKKKWGGK
jgi:hypothetical protein